MEWPLLSYKYFLVTNTFSNQLLLEDKCFFNTATETVCFCHVTYAFQSESTLYTCLNVRNFLIEAGAKSEV